MISANINYCVLCDEVRREDNGKLIVIGAYGGNVTVPRFPARMRFSLMMSSTAKEVGKSEFDFRARYDDQILVTAQATLDTTAIGMGINGLGPFATMLFEREGTLTFEARAAGSDEWKSLVVANVSIG